MMVILQGFIAWCLREKTESYIEAAPFTLMTCCGHQCMFHIFSTVENVYKKQ